MPKRYDLLLYLVSVAIFQSAALRSVIEKVLSVLSGCLIVYMLCVYMCVCVCQEMWTDMTDIVGLVSYHCVLIGAFYMCLLEDIWGKHNCNWCVETVLPRSV